MKTRALNSGMVRNPVPGSGKVKLVRYDPSFKDAWNHFLPEAKNASFLFHRDFMDYHKERFEDHSFLIFNEKEEVAGLFPANISRDNVMISHEGLSYGGLVLHKEEKMERTLLYFREILACMHNMGIPTLLYKEIPFFYTDFPCDEMQFAMFLLQAKVYRRDTSLTIKQRNRLPYQARRLRAVKLAQKSGIEIREDDRFEDFWTRILVPNIRRRYGVNPVHSLDEIKHLHSLFPMNIRQFNTYYQGKIMAGTTVFETSEVAHAQYISACEEGRRNGSLDFLFHHLIENAFSSKEYFDLGKCNEEDCRILNKGLLDWKEGFGARAISLNFYEIETRNFPLLDNPFVQHAFSK